MPTPKGWSPADVAARDRCVKAMLAGELPPAETSAQRQQSRKQRAFALCTAAVARRKKEGARE
jgi:hypothetical protein